jgi:hypothetical protein
MVAGAHFLEHIRLLVMLPVCGVDLSVELQRRAGPLYNFRIAVHLGPKEYRFALDLPTAVTGPIDWSAWHTSDDARLRSRIVKR